MYLHNLSFRFRWLQMPTGMLILLLQRTPLLRVAVQVESLFAGNAPAILRSAFAVVAMGTYNSLAGATVFNVTASPTAASPTSGAANATFAVAEDAGTAASIAVSVSGAPGNPRSYSVSGALPAGLTLVGGVGAYVNVAAPYKMTISGTPTTAGLYPLTITAWDGSNGSGGNSAKIKVNVTVNGGVSNMAPSIMTQPASQTVTAGGSASFSVAASGTPTPTYQWQKGGADIAGATSATYTIASVVAGDAGSFTAVATNVAGTATSTAATLTVNAATTAPAITSQPGSQTVTAGSSASFTVAASGNPAPTYQWQKGGVNIAGATSATYTIANVVAGDAGNYTAVATNSAGTATSTAATLSVNAATTAPSFTTQPTGLTVTAGGSAAFTVAATGNPTPTYQWKKGGVNIAGATSATYTIASAVTGDAGSYTAVATNSAGTATSAAATLTVNAATVAPSITSQPTSQTVAPGNPASFSVSASGTPAPGYQWQKGGVNIAGATGATYTIASAVAGDAGSYTAVATNSAGSATSAAATLTVSAATTVPVITTQPTNQTVTTGAAVSFGVTASGNPTPTFQWKKGGANIAGATSATYAISSVTAGDAGSYTAVATNSAGSVTSTAATLTVSAATTAPAFTTQPTSQTAVPGGSVSFTVAASGNPAPAYQWQKAGVNIAGATGATYSIASVLAGDAGSYAAVATNSAGSATSSAATLTVSAATSAPAITTQPASLTVTAGNAASFTVAASGNPAPSFQWYFGGAAIGGGTNATLALSNVQTANAGDYYASVTNSVGSAISATAKLTVQAQAAAPVRLVSGQIATVGRDVAISVAGPSSGLQWQVSSDAGATWGDVAASSTYSGVNTSILEILGVSSALNGNLYRCLPAGSSAAYASAATTLTVAQTYVPFPTSVAADSSGNLYVSDASAQTIQKVSSAGQVTLVAGSTGQSGNSDGNGAAARFNQPGALVSAPDGTLSVSDTTNNLVRVITASGNVTTLAGSAGSVGSADGSGGTARFWSPIGIARDASGGLIVADSRNHAVRRITTAGAVSTLAGSAGIAGATDGNGSGARFNNPAGVAVDSSGNVYVADAGNNTLRKISSTGAVTTLAGLAGVSGTQDGTGSGARFNNPGGLALGSSGEIYLADTGNSTIRKISPGGVVTTIAGLPGIPGLMDGTGGNAWFDQPEGLTLGSDGNLYVADTGNAVIRKVTLTGGVTTMAMSTGTTNSSSGPTTVPSSAPASSAGAGGGRDGGLARFGPRSRLVDAMGEEKYRVDSVNEPSRLSKPSPGRVGWARPAWWILSKSFF